MKNHISDFMKQEIFERKHLKVFMALNKCLV